MAKGAYIGVNNVARKIKKGYIGIENFTKRNLPAGYTQVEYIQSSGTQYIDTGFKPNQDTRLMVDMEVLTGTTSFLFGARANSSANSSSNSFSMPQISGTSLRADYGATETAIAISPTQRLSIDMNRNTTTVNGNSVTAAAQTFTGSYSLVLFSANTAGTVNSTKTVAKLYSCRIYDNGTPVRDYVPCTNSAGTAGLYDLVNGVFYTNAGTGTFAVGATYKGVARKIKKAYIGIGGVARPCWSGGELAYYGTITEMNYTRYEHAATANSEYALFAGGMNSDNLRSVEAYNKSLVRSDVSSSLSATAAGLAATTVGDYALFAGGVSGSAKRNYVNAYNKSLVKSSPTTLSASRYDMAATTIGNYALFAGGTGSNNFTTVDAYNTSLTKTSPSGLHKTRFRGAATTVGNYAIITGGYEDGMLPTPTFADIYDSSLTKTTIDGVSTPRHSLAATTAGNYALFAGGYKNNNTVSSVVDVYDKSLTRTTQTELSVARRCMAATTVGNFALFAGGATTDTTSYSTVDVYDESLTKTIMTALSTKRMQLKATTIGNFALFAGGNTSIPSTGTVYKTVDAYTVA